MSSATPIIRHDGEGDRMWFAGGGTFTWKATSEETGGAFLMIEDRMEQGKVTPLHVHPENEEAIYVLEGEILVEVEGERHRLGAGGLFVAPRGVAHAFMVTSESARVLGLLTPGSAEDFYRDAGEPLASEADESRPADFRRLREAAERSSSIEIVGPPPFEQAQPATSTSS